MTNLAPDLAPVPVAPSWRRGAALVKVNPPTPVEAVRLAFWTPTQYLRQLGVGGWVEDPRARAKATTRWEGTPLHRVTLDVHLDALRGGRILPGDIERDCEILHGWGLPVDPSDPFSEPPKIQVRYSKGQQLRWVVNDLTWRSETLHPETGRRIQADVTIELLEHVPAVLALSPVEQAQQQQPQAWGDDVGRETPSGRTYTVRAGDTLSSIAARELGSAGRWPEIYTLNSPPQSNTLLLGPDIIEPGQVLTLPAA